MNESLQLLQSLYPTYKENEWKLECLENEIKRRFEESKEDAWNINGLLISKKKRTTYKYDKAIYDYLDEERSMLPLAVKIPNYLIKTYDLAPFKTPGEHTVSLSPIRNKLLTEQKKEKITAFSEILRDEEFDRLINMLKVFRMKHKRETQNYELLKKEITKQLLSKGDYSVAVEEVGTLRLSEKGSDYDVNQIFSQLSRRYMAFAYKINGNSANVINLLNGDTFDFTDSINYDDCEMSVVNGELFAEGNPLCEDGILMEDHSYYKPVKLKKKEEKAYIESGLTIGYVAVSADPSKFFRLCEISSTKLTELMNEGILLPKEIERFKMVDKEINFIEIIEEVKDAERRSYFYDQMMERAQNHRKRNESRIDIDNLDDYLEDSV